MISESPENSAQEQMYLGLDTVYLCFYWCVVILFKIVLLLLFIVFKIKETVYYNVKDAHKNNILIWRLNECVRWYWWYGILKLNKHYIVYTNISSSFIICFRIKNVINSSFIEGCLYQPISFFPVQQFLHSTLIVQIKRRLKTSRLCLRWWQDLPLSGLNYPLQQ